MCRFPSLKDGKKSPTGLAPPFCLYFFLSVSSFSAVPPKMCHDRSFQSSRCFFYDVAQGSPESCENMQTSFSWYVPTGVGRLMPSLNASYSLKQNIMIYSDHSHCPSWPMIPKSEIDPSISKYMFSIGSLCPWILARESQPRGSGLRSAPPRRCCLALPEFHRRPPRRPRPGNGKMWIQWPEKYQLDTLHFRVLKCPLKCKKD